ncbi:MAG: ABC transporter permease [Eubacteriaceae bacterium]|jgi:cell division transport system permease protein|nr:ABC transporter permease [Eubacteriaceae bacterium]
MASFNKGSTLRSILREALQSISRNRLMSVISVLSITAALMILGIFVVFTLNIQSLTANVESRLGMQIFLSEDYTELEKTNLEKALMDNPNIVEVTFEDVLDAKEKFSDELENYAILTTDLTGEKNPLPVSFIIKVDKPENLEEVKAYVESHSGNGVEYIRYGDNYVDSLLRFNYFVNILSILVLTVLTIISFVLIYNTIKLTIYARRKEIGIMKYVGATDRYIRTPFVFEGMVLGLIAAISALLLLRLGYYYFFGMIKGNVVIPIQSLLASPESVFKQIIVFFIIYGMALGAIGSRFAMKKFLDV